MFERYRKTSVAFSLISSILIACQTMWILTHAFFAETFQPMNAILTFQIGLNDCAQAI